MHAAGDLCGQRQRAVPAANPPTSPQAETARRGRGVSTAQREELQQEQKEPHYGTQSRRECPLRSCRRPRKPRRARKEAGHQPPGPAPRPRLPAPPRPAPLLLPAGPGLLAGPPELNCRDARLRCLQGNASTSAPLGAPNPRARPPQRSFPLLRCLNGRRKRARSSMLTNLWARSGAKPRGALGQTTV